MDRIAELLKGLPVENGRGLEIAPLFRPIVTKQGHRVDYTDYMPTEELRARDQGHPDIGNLVNVDFVWQPGVRLADCAPTRLYDYAVSSHVLEHVPNPLGWLEQILEVCKPGAIIAMALPTKYNPIDFLRPETTISDWVGMYLENAHSPSAGQIFDCLFHSRNLPQGVSISQLSAADTAALTGGYTGEQAMGFAIRAFKQRIYTDVHCSVFTPDSFSGLVRAARELGVLDAELLDINWDKSGDPRDVIEFYVKLRKPASISAPAKATMLARLSETWGTMGQEAATGNHWFPSLKQRWKAWAGVWRGAPCKATPARAVEPVAAVIEPRAQASPVQELAPPTPTPAAASPVTHADKPPIYFPDGRVLIHTVDNQRLFLDMNETFMALHLIEHREWEGHLRKVLRALFFDGAVFIDIGANIGAHTLFAAALVGPKGKVCAIEPHPGIFSLLRSSVEVNGFLDRVDLVQTALGNAIQAAVEFQYFVEHPAMSGFSIAAHRMQQFGGRTEKLMLPSTTLDTLLADRGHQPDVVKIDVEGFEWLILQGATDLVEGNPDVVFLLEFIPMLMTEMLGHDAVSRMAEFFESQGFVPYLIQENGRMRQAEASLTDVSSGDILFIRPESCHFARITAMMDPPA